MRKRKINSLIDNILWTLLALTPFIIAFASINVSETSLTYTLAVSRFFDAVGVDITNNAFYVVLNGIFGVDTFGLNVASPAFLQCVAFFATVHLIHFVVDVLLFLIRLTQKFMDRWTND